MNRRPFGADDFIDPRLGGYLCVTYVFVVLCKLFCYLLSIDPHYCVQEFSEQFCVFVIMLVIFLCGYHWDNLIDCVATLGGNKSKYKKKGVRRIVSTEDYDPAYNKKIIEKGGSALRRLKGKTIVEYDGTEYFWPFPVFAVHEVNQWLQTATKNEVKFGSVDHNVVRRFVRSFGAASGVVDFSNFDLNFEDRQKSFIFLLALRVAVAVALYCVLEGGILWGGLSLLLACVSGGIQSQTVALLPLCVAMPIGVLVEEFHKWFFKGYCLFEFLHKKGSGTSTKDAIPPLLFHLGSFLLPVWLRVIAHCMYNFTVYTVYYWSRAPLGTWIDKILYIHGQILPDLDSVPLSAATLTKFAIGDKILWAQILQITKMAAEGLTSHIMACIFTFGWYDKLLDYLERSSLSVEFLLALVSPNVPVLTSTGSKISMLLSKLLPEFISKSPSYVALVTFTSCLIGCFAFGSFDELLEFLPMVDFSGLSVKDMALTAVEAAWTIARSLYKVYESGNLWEFFQRPKSFVLRMKIVELIGRKPESEESQLLLVKEVDELIEKLAYTTDPFFINQMVALTKKKDEYTDKVLTTKAIQVAAKFLGTPKDTLRDMEDALIEGERLASNPLLRAAPNIVTSLMNHGGKMRRAIRKVKDRTPPFVIILLGSPGTGKTTVIKQLVNAYFTSIGEVFDVAMKAELSMDDKYPAEGCTGNERVLVMNDLTGDHSQDTKSDRTSLGVYLQQIMDTVNLRFKSAGLDGKELVWTPDLVFVTTNDRNWVFSERTERLQRRFDEFAIIADLEVIEKEAPVPVDVFQKWDTDRRNACLSAKLVRANCTEKYVTLVTHVSPVWCHVSSFYQYVVGRFNFKPAREADKASLLQNTCPCGILYHSHFGPKGFVKFFPDKCEEVELSDLVKIPSPCLCGLKAGHEPYPLWDHSRDAEVASMLAAARAHVSSSISMRPPMGLSRTKRRAGTPPIEMEEAPVLTAGFAEATTILTSAVVIWMFFERALYVARILMKEFKEMSQDLTHDVEYKVFGIVEYFTTVFSPERVARAVARRSYLRTVRFLKDNSIYLAGGAGLVALWSYLTRPTLTGKVITPENIDRESLRVRSFTQAVNYPKEVREEWNVEEKRLNIVKLNKVGVSDENLELALSAQILPFKIGFGTDESMIGYALMLNASWCWASKHYFFASDGKFRKNVVSMKGIATSIGESDVVVVHSDAVIFRSPVVLPVKDLLGFFVEELSVTQIEGRVYASCDSVVRNIEVGPPPYTIAPNFLNQASTVWMMKKSSEAMAPYGECGLPVIVKSTKGYAIAGMVNFRWGSDMTTVYQGGVVITRGDLVKAMESHSEPHLTCLVLPDTGATKELDIHSEFRSLSTPFIDVIGSVGGGCSKFKSDFRETHLREFVKEKGLLSKPYSIPTRVSRIVGDGPDRQYISAFRATMEGILPNGLFDSDVVSRCVTKYVDYVVSGVDKEFPNLLCSPLSLVQAFLGHWDQDVVRCNFRSSVGPEDRNYRDRNGIFSEVLSESGDLAYSADPNFVSKIQSRLDLLAQGGAMCPWVCGAYKDEIRATEKLEKCEIRLFYTVDLYTNTLSRMYLLPLVQVLMRYPKLSKCFGKLNSGSSQWNDLWEYLKGGSANRVLMDLDFKKFDISHQYRLIRAVAVIFYRLARRWYKDEESARICYGLVFALCCQLFEHKTDFGLKHKGLPSGHIVTLILNCLVNVILMMVAFEKLCPDHEFFEEVFPATVGDDNISGVSDRVSSVYNLVALQPLYSRYGYTVTDASKSAVTRPFVPDGEAQFLKRKFRYEVLVKGYVAPLEKDSIYKMLSFWCARNDGGTSYTQRMSDVLDVAQREMFLHGRADFDEFVGLFRPEVQKYDWVVKWYSFDELVERYLANDQFMFWA